MIRPLLLALPLATLVAADWNVQVDQPDRWWDPQASHHGKHGLGGLAIGVVGYELASLWTDDRSNRIVEATAAGLVVGVGYEVYHGYQSADYTDPVDALWVGAGSLVGAVLTDLTHQAVSVAIGPHEVSAGLCYRF